MNTIFNIENGPSRDTLFDSCKYAYSEGANVPVEFSVALRYLAPPDDPGSSYVRMDIEDIRIIEIQHEDGSGHSFNLKGFCNADTKTISGQPNNLEQYRFKAYYNSKSRKGTISFSR